MAEDKSSTKESEAPAPDPNEGPGKGKAFFDRAKTVAGTGNYDYAIEMYVQGLNKEPFNIEEHKALREVGMRRKIAGGKSGGGLLGMGPKMPFKGKTPKEAMLNNTFTLARDVGNIPAMLAIVRNADILQLRELVAWMGPILREANRTTKSPKIEIYTELAEIYAKYEEYAKACEAMNGAVELKPNDMELAAQANMYAAQETMKRGKYTEAKSFVESIKDVQKTKELLQEENLARSEEYRLKTLNTAKADYEANPKELQVINKYAKALEDMEDENYENLAMEILAKAFKETMIYRLKMKIGDLRIRQYARNERVLKDAVDQDSEDEEMVKQYNQLKKERLNFELQEYQERAEHMPTDLDVKYDLGMRFWHAKKYDDAIVALQEAQNNPKRRVEAMLYLGRSFLHQGMKPEAVDTLKRAIESYDLAQTGDRKSQDLNYWYARALQDNAQRDEAILIYSRVYQWDAKFLDVRKRLVELREQAKA